MKSLVVLALATALGLGSLPAFAETHAAQGPASTEQAETPAVDAQAEGCMPGGGCCGACGAAAGGEPAKLGCPCQRRQRLLEEQRRQESESRQPDGG